jgi:hypothetical protein
MYGIRYTIHASCPYGWDPRCLFLESVWNPRSPSRSRPSAFSPIVLCSLCHFGPTTHSLSMTTKRENQTSLPTASPTTLSFDAWDKCGLSKKMSHPGRQSHETNGRMTRQGLCSRCRSHHPHRPRRLEAGSIRCHYLQYRY